MSFMSMTLFFLFFLHCLSSVELHSITITRFPSIRTFDLDGRVTVSGVEIRFSDPKLRHVHAIYGIRYASLGGEGSYVDVGDTGDESEFPELSEPVQQAAKRRFMHSVAAFIYETPARGHLQKTNLPPECPQPRGLSRKTRESSNSDWTARTASVHQILQPTSQKEDCLTLNIFVPESRSYGSVEPGFPVLIFVHGDSYEHGSGNGYDFSLFSSLGGSIVVTLNYRLGLLGFLSDSSAGSTRGNFALFDLQAAIQWVYSNIHRFGGDSERITLMGHSHGAALVHLFATSMLSIGPNYYGIKRIILFDGSAEAPWATGTCDTDIKSLVEENLHIPQSTSSTVFDLLQDLPVSSILEIQRNISRMGLEKCFSPLPTKQQIVTEKPTLFSQASLIYGQTEFAGSLFTQRKGNEDNIDQFTPALNYLMEHVFHVSPYPLTDLLKYVYAHSNVWIENNGDNDEKNKINEIYTDALFWSPALATLRQHESGQKRQISELDPQLEPLRHVIHFSQAGYGDDLNLLLGASFISSLHLRSSLSRRLSQSLIQFIANFIHYGDPNKHFEIPNIAENLSKSWPPFSIRNELGLKMVKPAISFSTSTPPEDLIGVISDHRKQFSTFWTDIFPKIADDHKKSSSIKSNTITHFLVHPISQYKDIKVNRLTTPSSRKISEPTAISGGLFTPSNESVEFPSFYDTNQTLSTKVKDEDKSILLLVIVVGLSLFLLNMIFTATFYFCHQQHKDQNNSILIPGSEVDHRTNKIDVNNKPINDVPSFQQSVVKLPGLTPTVNSPYQPQMGALPPDFAYRTLQRTPNPMERHMYSTPVNQTSPLANHRVMATAESNWKSDTLTRNSAGMI